MRVAKTDTIAGLPAPAARSLVRLFRGGAFAQDVADSLLSRSGIENPDSAFARMEEAGYLVRAEIDDDRYVWWEATTLGNALAMASSRHLPIRMRGNLVAAQMVGLMLMRYVIRLDPLAWTSQDDVVRLVAPNVQHDLTGDLT